MSDVKKRIKLIGVETIRVNMVKSEREYHVDLQAAATDDGVDGSQPNRRGWTPRNEAGLAQIPRVHRPNPPNE